MEIQRKPNLRGRSSLNMKIAFVLERHPKVRPYSAVMADLIRMEIPELKGATNNRLASRIHSIKGWLVIQPKSVPPKMGEVISVLTLLQNRFPHYDQVWLRELARELKQAFFADMMHVINPAQEE